MLQFRLGVATGGVGIGVAGVVGVVGMAGVVGVVGVGGVAGVVGVTGTDGLVGVGVHFASAARVFGPTLPHPVVAGVPLDAIPFCDCHFLTADSVSEPKKPVAESEERSF